MSLVAGVVVSAAAVTVTVDGAYRRDATLEPSAVHDPGAGSVWRLLREAGVTRVVIVGGLSEVSLSTRSDIPALLAVGIWAGSYALRADRRAE